MDIKVSVIVPVYNTGKYIATCLDSILAQTLPDIEIICLNDGSTDNSLRVLEHYAQFDSRVKVFNCSHQGIASARNAGINYASGEDILFVNCEDTLSSIAIEVLYNNASKNNSDVVLFDFVWKSQMSENYVQTTIKQFKDYYRNTPFSVDKMGSLSFKLMPMPAWTKLYNRQFLLEKTELFEENTYPDIPFWGDVYTSAQRITYVAEPLYFYNMDKAITISDIQEDNPFDIIEAYQILIKIFKNAGYFKQYKESIFALMMPNLLNKFNMVPKEFKEEFYSKMKALNKDISYKIYQTDSYTETERQAARLFETMKKDDYYAFVTRFAGGLND